MFCHVTSSVRRVHGCSSGSKPGACILLKVEHACRGHGALSQQAALDGACCARQVLPQLLNWLEADEPGGGSLDWGAIAVYCCTASCTPLAGAESAYMEEFAWVQPP